MITKAAVNLQSLRVEIGGYRIALFQAAFAARGLMFPHVRRLIVSPSNHYMVDHCPHTTILAGSDRYGPFKDPNIELVERAATLSDLECFALRTSWDGTLLKVLAETDMKVRTLLIPGTLGLHLTYEALAEPLSLLPSVKVLSIPGISELHAGFEPSDDDNTENSAQKRREAEERVAAFIFDRCPGLKELWFDQATKAIRKQEERGGSRGVSNAGLVWSRGDEIETPAWAGLI
ncbi:hypothetical protein BDW22DRAFT_952997 [Trametopsis cervina]|nr:hypothetical protein BDW22DRAFT_952997 [Trametopsis cervina]